MTNTDAKRIVAAIAQVRGAFIKTAVSLRVQGVPDVHTAMDCRDHGPAGIRLEFELEVEFPDGTGRTWWLELWSDESHWHLERAVLKDSAAGQDHALEFAPLHETDIDEVVAQLPVLCGELLSTVGEVVRI